MQVGTKKCKNPANKILEELSKRMRKLKQIIKFTAGGKNLDGIKEILIILITKT